MKKIKTQRILFIFLILLSLHNILQYYVDFGIISNNTLYFNYLISFILPIFLAITSNHRLNSYRVVFLFVVIITFFLTFFFAYNDIGIIFFTMAVYFQLISGYYSSNIKVEEWIRIFKIISILAITTSIYLLVQDPIDFGKVVRRGYTWGKLFYFAALYWGFIPFVLLSFLKQKKKYIYLSILYWLFAILINLLFLKRFILVDSVLLILVLLFLTSNKIRAFFYAFTFFLIGIFFFSNYQNADFKSVVEATSERVENTNEEGASNDRILESKNYFYNNSFIELIIGKGFSSSHKGLHKTAFALHIGWSNFIFKGGILLLFIIVLPYFKLLGLSNRLKKLPIKIQFSYWFLLISFFRLFYINMFSLIPELLLFFYCIFNIMDFNQGKIKVK